MCLFTYFYVCTCIMYIIMLSFHHSGGVYTSVVSATDADGFYNTFTYSIDNDYDGVFTMDSINRELRRTTNESISAPDAVSNSYHFLKSNCVYKIVMIFIKATLVVSLLTNCNFYNAKLAQNIVL